MGKMREVDIEQPNGELKSIEMTNLQWGLQYVKLKIQEMVHESLLFSHLLLNSCRFTTAVKQTNAVSFCLVQKVTIPALPDVRLLSLVQTLKTFLHLRMKASMIMSQSLFLLLNHTQAHLPNSATSKHPPNTINLTVRESLYRI